MALLPDAFSDLEPFAPAWALHTERERNAKRLSSDMDDIRAFYTAVTDRLGAISAYLGAKTRDSLSEADRNLLHLTLSVMEVAPAVELYRQPDVVEAIAPEALVILET